MPVARADIEWAHRLLLGREPESEAVIGQLLRCNSLDELARNLIHTEEFQHRFPRYPERECRFLDTGPVDIQTDCTPAEVEELTRRIAGEWRRFGETQPHWSVLTWDKYFAEHISENIEDFYATGNHDLQRLLSGVARAGLGAEGFQRALEFGCGVGRLALPLALRAAHVTGLDISPAHVRLARERAESQDMRNVEFVAIDSLAALDGFQGFDLVISYLVIQHNPPPVQAMIVRKLLQCLAPGGVAAFQVPTYLANATKFSVAGYLATPQPAMEMNALPQARVFDAIDECGCVCLEVAEDNLVGDLGVSQTFTVQKRRS